MADEVATIPAPIILKMGRHSDKKVKQLKNGRGPLMHRVLESVKEMESAGVIASGAAQVIVVIRQENAPFFG